MGVFVRILYGKTEKLVPDTNSVVRDPEKMYTPP